MTKVLRRVKFYTKIFIFKLKNSNFSFKFFHTKWPKVDPLNNSVMLKAPRGKKTLNFRRRIIPGKFFPQDVKKIIQFSSVFLEFKWKVNNKEVLEKLFDLFVEFLIVGLYYSLFKTKLFVRTKRLNAHLRANSISKGPDGPESVPFSVQIHV